MEVDNLHRLFLLNYVIFIGLFICIFSDMCGIPSWYEQRESQNIPLHYTDIQYVSENIMRCKYATDDDFVYFPIATIYSYTFVLLQTLYTWTQLHLIRSQQIGKMDGALAEQLRCQSQYKYHFLFVLLMLCSFGGFVMVVIFDHVYVPSNIQQNVVKEWTEHMNMHYTGVVLLVNGFFGVHVMTSIVYLLGIWSYKDFTVMCDNEDEDSHPKSGIFSMPNLRRVMYILAWLSYATVVFLFVWFFVKGNSIVILVEYVLVIGFLVLSIGNLILSNRLKLNYHI